MFLCVQVGRCLTTWKANCIKKKKEKKKQPESTLIAPSAR